MTNVLLIDDHPIVLQGCRYILEDAGVCELMEAGTALSGYRLFRRRRPDVVIVDLALSGSGLAGCPWCAGCAPRRRACRSWCSPCTPIR